MPKIDPSKQPQPEAGRFGRASGASPNIQRANGKFGAGLIEGVSLASVGEALGHSYWLDAETLSQVAKMSDAKGDTGLKARFTHPGMSSDGMGRHLGRLFNVRVEGEKVLGDLHFVQSAHETPDGDLAEYVMTLTEEDSKAAGLSIVFHHDFKAEQAFMVSNGAEWVEHDDGYERFKTLEGFRSPDAKNTNNYPHVRMTELRAADVVDEPAANPDGMFDTVGLPREADELLAYAAGLSENKPTTSTFGVDGDRASQFLGRWLDSHGLSIVPKELAEMTTKPDATIDEPEVVTPPTREDFAAELNTFTAKFGAENGAKWFGENKTFSEALELHCDALQASINAETERADQAEERLKSLSLGESEPLETGSEDSAKPKKTFAEATRKA